MCVCASVAVYLCTQIDFYIHRPNRNSIESNAVRWTKTAPRMLVRQENSTSDWGFWMTAHTNVYTLTQQTKGKEKKSKARSLYSSAFHRYFININQFSFRTFRDWYTWYDWVEMLIMCTHIFMCDEMIVTRNTKELKMDGIRGDEPPDGWEEYKCTRSLSHSHTSIESVMVPPFIDKNDVAFLRNKILAGYILYRERLRLPLPLPLHQCVCVSCFCFFLLLLSCFAWWCRVMSCYCSCCHVLSIDRKKTIKKNQMATR